MKDKTAAGIIALFLGGIGIHRFYLGQNLLGCIYLGACWTFIPAIVALIDGFILQQHSRPFLRGKNRFKNAHGCDRVLIF